MIVSLAFFIFQGPREVSGLQKQIVEISAGYYHSCAITGSVPLKISQLPIACFYYYSDSLQLQYVFIYCSGWGALHVGKELKWTAWTWKK